ncbi:serine/threonine-protein kinase 31-like [Chiloscyllium punctatum]|uniref:serine/threonine-protein kinase 31-like n=1 Tax=Chiloscyllium punctatum TaxID=137246 RepID=UPI003B642179
MTKKLVKEVLRNVFKEESSSKFIGRSFLASLVNDKIIRVNHRDTAQDGAFLVDAQSDALDVGQEVMEKGFAEKCRTTSAHSNEGIKSNVVPLISGRNAEGFQGFGSGSQRMKITLDLRNDRLGNEPKGRVDTIEYDRDLRLDHGNTLVCSLERQISGQCRPGKKLNMVKMQHDQKLLEDQNEKLRVKNSKYLQNCNLLQGQIKQQQHELKIQPSAKGGFESGSPEGYPGLWMNSPVINTSRPLPPLFLLLKVTEGFAKVDIVLLCAGGREGRQLWNMAGLGVISVVPGSG